MLTFLKGGEGREVKNYLDILISYLHDSLPNNSIKSSLPSKDVFHQRFSSIKGHLSSKVNFHQTLSSIKGCPPLNGYLPFDQKIFLNSIFPCTWVFPRCKKNFILLVPHFFPNFAPPSAKRLPNRQFEIQKAGRGSLDEKKSYKIFPIFQNTK